MTKKKKLSSLIGTAIKANRFVEQHKDKSTDFTRKRVLDFPMIFILVLKKNIKSLQLILNESFIQKYIGRTIRSSAYSQAKEIKTYGLYRTK